VRLASLAESHDTKEQWITLPNCIFFVNNFSGFFIFYFNVDKCESTVFLGLFGFFRCGIITA
jgi:hypothetical protein